MPELTTEQTLVVLVVLTGLVWTLVRGMQRLGRYLTWRHLGKVIEFFMALPVAAALWLRDAWYEYHTGRHPVELRLDDDRFSRTPEEELKGTEFYVIEAWAKPPWEDKMRLFAYKLGITANKASRMATINNATFTRNVVVVTLPLGEDFEQYLLRLTIAHRTDGWGEEWRWPVDEVREIVETLKQWEKPSRSKGYIGELGGGPIA